VRKFKQLLAGAMSAVVLFSGVFVSVPTTVEAATGGGDITIPTSKSIEYVTEMGSGWNLGNSFDGFEADLDKKDTGELAWGNPTVTKEFIQAVKEKGYSSIRMPFTVYRRYTVNENAGEDEYKYVINAEWLARYKEVVDWAVEEGLYVMVNIHHDSWIWLKYWDGNKESEEYRMYCDFWKQLADYMKDEPEQVCFETINEPDFGDTGDITAQDKLDEINRASYEIIRSITENKERMIIMPTMYTRYTDTEAESLYQFITELNDENIIATVHYYSEWVYSANLGKTGFDEALWDDYTPRKAVDSAMETIYQKFTSKGIGVVVGEYGLLGYDSSEGCLETGEELKYYEYMNEMARNYKVCLMFWDNGSGIDRNDTEDYSWKKAEVGEMLETSMTKRSSYATGLDNLYFAEEAAEDVEIPLTLNGGASFVGIEGLTEGTDYTYDSDSAVVVLKKEYINSKFAEMDSYGTFATLVMKFSSGADWREYLIKYAAPVVGSAEGTRSEGIKIPVEFNGSRVRRVTAYQASGKVGPNSSWWDYLKYDSSFGVDYENGTFSLLNEFFADSTVNDGLTKIKVEYFDGRIQFIMLNIDGETVTCSADASGDGSDISVSSIICLYAGETEIPAQYLQIPEGASVYGTWVEDNDGMVTLEGWPAVLVFDTKAHENFVYGGIVVYYMDTETYLDVSFGIKDAPVVADTTVAEPEKQANVTVSNLAEDAKLTYSIGDTSIATVDENGCVTGKKAGETTITVTVEQYNRTDSFTGKVTVGEKKAEDSSSKDETDPTENNSTETDSSETGTTETGTTETGETDAGKTFTSGKYTYKITGASTAAFTGLKSNNVTKVTIPKTVKYQNKTYKVTSVGAKALYKNNKVTNVTIGANVKTVGADAFTGCGKLKNVSVKKGVTFTIGAYKYITTGSSTLAFSGVKSTKTTKVTIADKVKIGAKAFKVTSIENKALYKNTKVTKVTIGANVKKIGSKAFYGCKKLGNIKVNSKVLTTVGSNAFKGTKSTLKISVPSGKVNDYKKLFKNKGLGSKAKVVKK